MYEGRQAGNLTPQKLEFARTAAEAESLPAGSSLLEATQQLQPSALIGAAAKQGAFSADVIQALTQVHEPTIISTMQTDGWYQPPYCVSHQWTVFDMRVSGSAVSCLPEAYFKTPAQLL